LNPHWEKELEFISPSLQTTNMTTIALADDHTVMRNGLASLLKGLGYEILFEADNGKDFINKINKDHLPDVALLDINMPQMDGYETAAWLKENFPEVNVLALSMYDDEAAIIRMLKNGARGYVLKDSNISDVKAAIESGCVKGILSFRFGNRQIDSLH
jgi:DNA-binding NarL/FixJ family response regulator